MTKPHHTTTYAQSKQATLFPHKKEYISTFVWVGNADGVIDNFREK